MKKSNRVYRSYLWIVVVTAFGVLTALSFQWVPEDLEHLFYAVAGLVVIHFFGIALGEGTVLNFDFLVYAITLFAYGPTVMGWAAVIVNFLYLALNKFRRRRKLSLEHTLFSGAQFALSGFGADAVYHSLHGNFGLNILQISTYLPELCAMGIFFLINSALVYLGFLFDSQIRLTVKKFLFYFLSDICIYLFTGFTALMLIHFYSGITSFEKLVEFSILTFFLISPIIALNLGIRLYRQIKEMRQLFEIIRLLNSPGEFTNSLRHVLKLVSAMISFDQCCVWETNPQDNSVATLCICYPETKSLSFNIITEGEGLRGKMLRAREMEHIPNLQNATGASAQDPQAGSLVIIPLVYENEIVGLIDFYRKYADFYDKRNLPTMKTLSFEIASSIVKDRMFRKVQQAAVTDKLTGLYNRLYFEDRLDFDIKRGKRYGHMVSLLFMDIDHFKICNDTYGHTAGDEVLCQLCDLLRNLVRKTDLVARYGGEEIVIVLPSTSKEQAAALAEKIRITVSDHEFTHETAKIHTTVSIGVASYPADANESDDLIKKTDFAMYEAKKQGRNKVVISSPYNNSMTAS